MYYPKPASLCLMMACANGACVATLSANGKIVWKGTKLYPDTVPGEVRRNAVQHELADSAATQIRRIIYEGVE